MLGWDPAYGGIRWDTGILEERFKQIENSCGDIKICICGVGEIVQDLEFTENQQILLSDIFESERSNFGN